MNLWRVEIARSVRREAVRFLAIAGLAGILVGCSFFALTSRRPTSVEWAQARASLFEATGECGPSEAPTGSCGVSKLAPWLSPELRFFDLSSLPKTIEQAGVLLVMAGWLLGATLAGGDFESGVLATQLTWEPRRSRFYMARLGATCLIALVLSLIALALLTGGLAVVAIARGLADPPSGFWLAVVGVSIRVGLLSLIAAAVSTAVTFLSRSAAFAVASLMVYIVVLEIPIHLFYPTVARWLFLENSMAWVTGSREAIDMSAVSGQVALLSPIAALLLMLLSAAVLSGLARARFIRRDVS